MPVEIDRDGVARGAGLRRGEQALFADQPVDQGRLAGIRTSDNGDANGMRLGGCSGFDLLCGRLRQRRAQRVIKIGEALIVLGRQRDRLAEAEFVRFKPARFAGGAFHLVGDQHGRLAGLAHDGGEGAVDRRRPGARIDHEEHRVGLRDRGLGLRPHAAGETVGRRLFEPGGIDDGEVEIAQPALACAPVARDARLVVDQRQAPADQPVEECRFADIGPADNGDGETHETIRAARDNRG